MRDDDAKKKGLQMREELASAGKRLEENALSIASEELIGSIRPLIEQAKARVAQSVNSELVLLYWQIGKTHQRGSCQPRTGPSMERKLVELVSEKLTAEYGKGFRRSNVFHMIRFAEVL